MFDVLTDGGHCPLGEREGEGAAGGRAKPDSDTNFEFDENFLGAKLDTARASEHFKESTRRGEFRVKIFFF